MHVLEADGIRVEFRGRQVLSNIYLRVQTGQLVALLGRNGSGKSVLLQTIFGTRAVADASVRVDGQRVVAAFRHPGLFNCLPQTSLLPAELRLAQAAKLLDVNYADATAGFPELRARAGQRMGELSGGLGRLAQTLLLLHAKNAFTLLDEPFSGVMPIHCKTLAAEMQSLKHRKGLLITDHRYADVLPICDVVYLLHQGRLLELKSNVREELKNYGYLTS